ncbi:MAG TPA: outer membrane protein assembly factor BamA [Bacteroidia bacterium]|nr:outer membrane protein assembly factor BamA [Bacteroidia bacterium]
MHKKGFTIYDLRFTICRNWAVVFLFIFSISINKLQAQVQLGEESTIDYANPKEYTIGGITVSGIRYLDENVLKTLSGLAVGDKIKVPGEKISKAIENLWKQNLLADVKIEYTKIEGDNIFLNIAMTERPRLSKFSFTGVTKSEANKLREKINLVSGKIVNENLIKVTSYEVKEFFTDKGYLNATVKIDVINDSIPANSQTLTINVEKNKKTKIHKINIEGNTVFKDKKLRRQMKDTKQKQWWNVFRSSKFIEENLVQDKQRIIDKYTEKGYRDARIVFDTVYRYNKKMVNIDLRIDEGHKYYFRTITWVGNTKYRSGQLDTLLGIRKGDVYNQKRLDEGLNMSANGRDISSLYMDDGYLFFQINPVEIQVENDSIDIEMRMYEGKQATINKITVTGNTKTNDKVVLREIRTKPGQLFSRQDVIRTQRELAQLGYFDPEKLGVNPKPNAADGTVDIDYVVEEKPSDQVELSGGWGAGQVVGTLGVSFNNFSARNIFRKGNWTPLPSGDGQKLSLRFQTNGVYYQSYNASFTEPWLGGKKANALSVSFFRSVQTNGQPRSSDSRQSISINGASVGLGKRLQWPDDFFSIYYEASYSYYALNNYQTSFLFSDGYSNNLNFQVTLSRNSVNQPIYPSAGTSFAFTIQATPPYSLFSNTDYTTATDRVKYKFIEYHKWKFTSSWFTPITGKKLILATKASFGFLGYYNKDIGQSPFERFYLGGDGLSGFSLDGREIIAHRGYDNQSLSPSVGGTIYDKFTMELRYPVSLNPNATIYGMGFLEAGNSWSRFRDYNPFAVKRTAGVGIRIFLPMFGLLGLDWGYGFDRTNYDPLNAKHHGAEFQFTLGQQF